MTLETENGGEIRDPTEDDIRRLVTGDGFAILAVDDHRYIQCSGVEGSPGLCVLEYQDGSLHDHHEAADGPVPLDRAIAAFLKYRRGDDSWREDFRWERMDLG